MMDTSLGSIYSCTKPRNRDSVLPDPFNLVFFALSSSSPEKALVKEGRMAFVDTRNEPRASAVKTHIKKVSWGLDNKTLWIRN